MTSMGLVLSYLPLFGALGVALSVPLTDGPGGNEPITMRFGDTILYVEDVKATIEFYERAFGIKRRFLKEGDYGELETGATRLAFAANEFARRNTAAVFETAGPGKAAPPVELAMVTEDVELAFQKALEAGATPVSRPDRKPWGQTVGYVRDLNGFLIELCSPMP